MHMLCLFNSNIFLQHQRDESSRVESMMCLYCTVIINCCCYAWKVNILSFLGDHTMTQLKTKEERIGQHNTYTSRFDISTS